MKIYVIILFFVSLLLNSCMSQDNDASSDTTFCLQMNETESVTETTQSTDSFTEPAAVISTELSTFPTTESIDIPAGSYSLRFESEQTNEYMDYWINIPKNPQIGLPIIVFLHGKQEIDRMDLLEKYGIVSVTEELYDDDFPFILLVPCTHEYGWTSSSVAATLKELIESVCEEYDADPSRIIITGHSLGSIGTWNMISRYGDFFSAAVPISCGSEGTIDYANCGKVAIMAFCGNDGEYEMKYNWAMRALVSKINEAGGNAVMNTADGANHDDTVTIFYTKELFDWMLAQ